MYVPHKDIDIVEYYRNYIARQSEQKEKTLEQKRLEFLQNNNIFEKNDSSVKDGDTKKSTDSNLFGF